MKTDSYGEFMKKRPWNKGKKMPASFRAKIRDANRKRWNNDPESYLKIKYTPVPSPELSYLLGVRYGDGCLCCSNKWYMFKLGAVDKEFVEKFRDAGCKILNTGVVPKISIRKSKRKRWNDIYYCQFCSKQLYLFLSKNLQEHDFFIKKYPIQFIQGFFDSEGSMSLLSCTHLRVHNTNKKIILYVKSLLDALNIEMNFHVEKRPPNKTMYSLGTGKRKIINQFYKKVGFSIKRKQSALQQYVESNTMRVCGLCNDIFVLNSGAQIYCNDCKKITTKLRATSSKVLREFAKKLPMDIRNKKEKITRINADIDRPQDLPICVATFTRYGFDNLTIKKSPSKKGYHVEGWHPVGVTLFYNLLIRLLAKDDSIRVSLDAKGNRAIQVLFSEKEKRKLDKTKQSIKFDNIPMQYETKGSETNVKISFGEIE